MFADHVCGPAPPYAGCEHENFHYHGKCVPLGACCLEGEDRSQDCWDDMSQSDCESLGGVYQGAGSQCTAPRACCLVYKDNYGCVLVDPLCCDEEGGWIPASPICLGDANNNHIDDACEGVCPGDSSCDDYINWRDIDYFVAAMNDNVAAWTAMFWPGAPTCGFDNNDVNADGTVNWRDIDAFVAVMNTACP